MLRCSSPVGIDLVSADRVVARKKVVMALFYPVPSPRSMESGSRSVVKWVFAFREGLYMKSLFFIESALIILFVERVSGISTDPIFEKEKKINKNGSAKIIVSIKSKFVISVSRKYRLGYRINACTRFLLLALV